MEVTQAELDLEKLRASLPKDWRAWKVSVGVSADWTFCAQPPWETTSTVEEETWTAALDACWLQHRKREDEGKSMLPRRRSVIPEHIS